MDLREFNQWVHRRVPRLMIDKVHCYSFSWFRHPLPQWPLSVMSSVAYSGFVKICLGICLQGQSFHQIPLDSPVELSILCPEDEVTAAGEPAPHILLS